MSKIAAIYILLFCPLLSFSQTGTLNIKEDFMISTLMNQYLIDNQQNNKIKGWTIIVTSTTDRRIIEEQKLRFLQLFPELEADWFHDKPYYKLRFGAFKRKADALHQLQRIKTDFPSSYPAQDQLDVIQFIEY